MNIHREFYKNLIYFFSNDKTSWGKVELVSKIKDIYNETLDEEIQKGHTCQN